jgi:hypothetical protein
VLGRLIRKILYIGAFAFIINSFSTLSDIIFRSFAQAGLTAGGGTITAADLLKPGRLAGTGFSAAWPLLQQVNQYLGFTTFFDNFLTIVVLLVAWVIVILAFFILAVQMFVTILEFKLTTLAGFILVPFALWNRTSFLAERVLGNVVVGHQGHGARRHRRHRLELLHPVHHCAAGPGTRHRTGHEPGAGKPCPLRARHLRSRHRLGSCRGRAAAGRRRSARHRAWRGRHRASAAQGWRALLAVWPRPDSAQCVPAPRWVRRHRRPMRSDRRAQAPESAPGSAAWQAPQPVPRGRGWRLRGIGEAAETGRRPRSTPWQDVTHPPPRKPG